MQRLMIQADEELLSRARRRAYERGVSVAQVVRDALARELGDGGAQPALSCVGAMESEQGDLSERASRDEYEPPPWRS